MNLWQKIDCGDLLILPWAVRKRSTAFEMEKCLKESQALLGRHLGYCGGGNLRILFKRLLFFFSMSAMTDCGAGSDEQVERPIAPSIVVPVDPAQDSWKSEGKDIVAHVEGIPIHVSDVRAVLQSGVTDNPQEALRIAVENEAVAQWAAKNPATDLLAKRKQELRFKQAMVQRLLKSEFEEKLTVDTVPFSYVESAFWSPALRKRYIHFDAFRVRDIQYLCCWSMAECQRRKDEIKECMNTGAMRASELHKIIEEARPRTPKEFEDLANLHMAKVDPKFGLHEFGAFYDVKVSYEENTRVDRMTKSVIERVKTMKVNELTEPVEDEYGWHIMYLMDHRPEANRRPEDPEVRREISEGIYSRVQEQELIRMIAEGLKSRQVEIRLPQLRVLAQEGKAAR